MDSEHYSVSYIVNDLRNRLKITVNLSDEILYKLYSVFQVDLDLTISTINSAFEHTSAMDIDAAICQAIEYSQGSLTKFNHALKSLSFYF